jgi:hypothetical protein
MGWMALEAAGEELANVEALFDDRFVFLSVVKGHVAVSNVPLTGRTRVF